MPGSEKRLLEWSEVALAAYEATLAKILEEDPFTAARFEARVNKSIALILENPALGTPSKFNGRRVYAVPGTGHSFNYRIKPGVVQIARWYRQQQNIPR